MKVLMLPHVSQFRTDQSGIRRVVEAYFRYLPGMGIDLVEPDTTSYDLKVVHAGMTGPDCDVAHLHGIYWTADYETSDSEYRVNARIVEALRHAAVVTVPSDWVAQTLRRDMRLDPWVIPHGIEWKEWQHNLPNEGYVLWNKNRVGDVCDPFPISELARRCRHINFRATFLDKGMQRTPNIKLLGLQEHAEMKETIQKAGVYLSTVEETFGIGTLEAMASGVPVLGFAHGGNLELVEHEVTGYLVRPGDYDALQAGLYYCLNNRDRLREAAVEAAKQWSWQSACETLIEVYEEATRQTRPTVSIIIPTYNYADKVGGAIDSAIKQTYSDLVRIVVVDDGSTDNVREIVEWYESEDSRVRYHRQDNAGVANARNTGIRLTGSKYVCCLDADDMIGPDFIAICVDALEKDRSLGIAYGPLWYTKPDGETGLSEWPPIVWDYDRQLEGFNQIPTCCVFRRDIWERLGGYRQRYAPLGAGEEDAEFWMRIGSLGYEAKFVEAVPGFTDTYRTVKKALQREPSREDMVRNSPFNDELYISSLRSCFLYSWQSGRVSGNASHTVSNWTGWYPWSGKESNGKHPFASIAKPVGHSHPVRRYANSLVSVIVPVGPKHSRLVLDSLDSIEAQTFHQWEMIIVWDNNDLDGRDVVRKAYPHATLVQMEDGGVGAGAARNVGVEYSTAPFILFLDADDRLYPKCLERMFEEWNKTEAIIYTDYVGKAEVDDPSQLSPNLTYIGTLPDGKAIIGHRAAEYDCAEAQRQPKDPSRPYVWCNVTCLLPKNWFEDVGGFDEDMRSWEDVDLHWRLARNGKCYHRIPEQLLVYQFYTGTRRSDGEAIRHELFDYLKNKYEGGTVAGCGSCGGNRTQVRVAVPANSRARRAELSTVGEGQGDFIKAEYTSPNTGDHRVIGGAGFAVNIGVPMIKRDATFYIDYGYRSGGETFLVHRKDIELSNDRFRPVEGLIALPS